MTTISRAAVEYGDKTGVEEEKANLLGRVDENSAARQMIESVATFLHSLVSSIEILSHQYLMQNQSGFGKSWIVDGTSPFVRALDFSSAWNNHTDWNLYEGALSRRTNR
jgi:hypothetical protein